MQGAWVQSLVQEDPTVPQGNEIHTPQLLSLCSRAGESQILSSRAITTEAGMPMLHNRRSHGSGYSVH